MNDLMKRYIDEQPALVKNMTEKRSAIAQAFLVKFGGIKPKRIFLFGSGSSFHVACIAKPMMEKLLGIEVTVEVPSHLSYLSLIQNPEETLYFALSQGGASRSTISKLREIKAKGGRIIGITENNDTPIARESDFSLPLQIGHEAIGAKTKGVTATVLTLILLALEWPVLGAGTEAQREVVVQDLLSAAARMPENIKLTRDWIQRNREAMVSAGYMAVLGEKFDYGVTLEFALKLLETIYRPVFAYDFGEYLHGCQNMVDQKSSLIFLMPGDPVEKRSFITLGDFCRSQGAACYFISRGDLNQDDTTLNLQTTGNDALAFLEFLIPAQLLSAHLSEFAGIDVSKFKFSEFGRTMGLHVV
jgi:glucoselysine-6-phosphate deglycase